MTLRQPDITRDKILEAAFQEMYKYGFQAASLSNILERTGLTKGALYHHFPDKDRLGHAVIEEVIRESLETMVFAPLRTTIDPIGTLREGIQSKAEKATGDTVALGCPLNNLMQEMSPLDADFKRRLTEILKTWQDVVTDALKRGQKAGQVRQDVDCRAAALFIVSAYEGCIGTAKNLQSVKEFRLCMAQLVTFVEGLQVKGR
jgi:AcrR family transcriptional regulator